MGIFDAISKTDKSAAGVKLLNLMTFHTSGRVFATGNQDIQSLNRIMKTTKASNASDYIGGRINLSGPALPIINICKGLGTELVRIVHYIVVEINNSVMRFNVKSRNEGLRAIKNIKAQSPAIASGIGQHFNTTQGNPEDRFSILPDIEKIILSEEITGYFRKN